MPLSIHGTNGITFNDGSTQNTRPAVGFRNRIINDDMRIDQRNAGASVSVPNGTITYITGRWNVYEDTSGFISSQRSTTAPDGGSGPGCGGGEKNPSGSQTGVGSVELSPHGGPGDGGSGTASAGEGGGAGVSRGDGADWKWQALRRSVPLLSQGRHGRREAGCVHFSEIRTLGSAVVPARGADRRAGVAPRGEVPADPGADRGGE